MRVLVACEYSGVTRRAFAALGHEAWSCDLLESEDNSPYHHIGDVTPLLTDHWDLMVCHPPCQHLSRSGATYWADKVADGRQSAALTFVCTLMAAPIPKIALENPVGIISTIIGRPSQYIQPWQFGHGETKKTGLWLKGLPVLQPTNVVPGRENRVAKMPERKSRWMDRSRSYPGIAAAMAAQWGNV